MYASRSATSTIKDRHGVVSTMFELGVAPASLRRLHGNVARRADDHGVAGGGTKLANVKAFADFIDGESKAGLVRSGVLRNVDAALALAAGALKIPCVVVSSRHHQSAN